MSKRSRSEIVVMVRVAVVALAALAGVALAVPVQPSDIAGLELWLKGDAGVTTPGGSVSQWADQSGNSRHAVQGTAANQPQHVLGALGGLPVVAFDGSNDKLLTTGDVAAQAIFIVNRVETGAKSLAGIIGRNGADKGIRRISSTEWRHPGDGNDFTNPGGSMMAVDRVLTNVAAENTWHILAATRSTGTQAYNAFGGYFGGRELGGDIAEVVVYNRALNDTEQNQVGYYLEQKYGLDTGYDAGPPAPAPVTGGLQLWLAADAGVVSSGGSVVQWNDQSGSGRHAVQLTTAKQPQEVAGELNGLPVVRFDGTDDQLIAASRADAQTIFVVNRVDTGAPSMTGLIGRSGDKGIRRISNMEWRHPGDGNDFTNPAGSAFYINGAAGNRVAENTWHVVTATRGGGTMDYDTLGGYYPNRQFSGDYAEVMVYDRALSTVERHKVGFYLSDKWDLNYSVGIGGLGLWLRADRGVTSAGGSVSQWADQSGNGRDALQATAGRQPQHIAGALNGMDVVRFDGTDDQMVTTSRAGAQTIFAVNRVDTGAKSLCGLIGRSGDKGIRRISTTEWRHPGDGNDFTNPAGSAFYINGLAGNTVAEDTWHIVTAVRNGSTMDYDTLGGYYPNRQLRGDYAEVLVFNRKLNTPERIVTENYLASKYDLALAANDHYAGDTAGNGDYDLDVFGIGSLGGEVHSADARAGLILLAEDATLDDGEFVLAGHRVEENRLTGSGVPNGFGARWERAWFVDETGDVDLVMAFDFSDAGLAGLLADAPMDLLYSSADGAPFTNLGLSPTILGDRVMFDVPGSLLQDGYYTLGIVPEPCTLALLAFGGLGLVARRRRK